MGDRRSWAAACLTRVLTGVLGRLLLRHVTPPEAQLALHPAGDHLGLAVIAGDAACGQGVSPSLAGLVAWESGVALAGWQRHAWHPEPAV